LACAVGGGRTLRRTLLLAGLVALAAVLVIAVRPPVRRAGLYAVRGHRVFGVARADVRGLEISVGERRVAARRTAGGWEIAGRPARANEADALNDLLDTLVGLRAVDAFRRRDQSSFGFDRPRAEIDLLTDRGRRRLILGNLNAAASAVYARRERDPRVFTVGSLLLTEIERVFVGDQPPA